MNPFKDVALYVAAGLAALFVALAGWLYVSRAHLQTEFAQYKASVALLIAQAQASARARERELTQTNERLTDELAAKDRTLVARDTAARRSDAGLRDEINRLNARPAPANPEAAHFAHEAGVARELLGECSEAYRGVARETDALRDQVSGLQTYVEKVVQPGQ